MNSNSGPHSQPCKHMVAENAIVSRFVSRMLQKGAKRVKMSQTGWGGEGIESVVVQLVPHNSLIINKNLNLVSLTLAVIRPMRQAFSWQNRMEGGSIRDPGIQGLFGDTLFDTRFQCCSFWHLSGVNSQKPLASASFTSAW